MAYEETPWKNKLFYLPRAGLQKSLLSGMERQLYTTTPIIRKETRHRYVGYFRMLSHSEHGTRGRK